MAENYSDTKRPNFLFIVTDQHRADHLGCYGHPVVKTPNIDSIAARGRRFDKFYVACAICQPNRSTMMTGRMPSLHGVRHNGVPLDLQQNTFVDLMRLQGYRTALIGKSHLMNMTPLEPRYGRPEPVSDKIPVPEGFEHAVPVDHDSEIYDQEHPKNVPRASQERPKSGQERPRAASDAPRDAQEAPSWASKTSKRSPRRSKRRPRRCKRRPRGSKLGSKDVQELPKTLPEAPKTLQEVPKTLQEASKTLEVGLQSRPRGVQEP